VNPESSQFKKRFDESNESSQIPSTIDRSDLIDSWAVSVTNPQESANLQIGLFQIWFVYSISDACFLITHFVDSIGTKKSKKVRFVLICKDSFTRGTLGCSPIVSSPILLN
jgi:hypothetical protein